MGWLIRLAKKRYGQAKSLVKKAAPQVKGFLNALPTVNENVLYDKPNHTKKKKPRSSHTTIIIKTGSSRKKKKQDNYLDQLL
jgi:hypothetical protein